MHWRSPHAYEHWDPEARVFEFMHNIFSRLEGVGYGDFKKENPKVMIQLIQEAALPAHTKSGNGQTSKIPTRSQDRPKGVH